MIPEKGKYYRCKDDNLFGFTRDHIYLSKKDNGLVSDNGTFESESTKWENLFEEVTPDVVDIHRRHGKVHEGLVNHPLHYNTNNPKIYVETDTGLKEVTIECIDVIRNMPSWKGNIIKYAWRAGLKQEVGKSDVTKEIEDLEKAKWYIDDRIKQLKALQ